MSLQARMSKHLQTMSVWKRELFKWNRPEAEKDAKYAPDMQPLVCLGNVDPSNADLKQLHSAAMHGRKKDILEILHKGIWIDFPNDAGQTALFCATLRGQYGTAELLLQNGANPNEKSDTGMTPVHVACLKASLRALGAMIEAGGDLRLHDNQGNGCIDWARYHPDPKKRLKMLEFLQKSQLFALNYSGDYIGYANSLDRQPSILQMLRGKVGSQMSLDFGQETGLRRVHSYGYGRVYYGGEAASGVVSVIPLLTENQLQRDIEGISFDISCGFTMSSMLWNMTPVSIKQQVKQRLGHHSVDMLISERHSADLLIAEVEHLSKLRHPNILLLMGLCQASTFDKVMLAFERVSIGSLYHILHEKIDHLPMTYVRDICSQICQALLYIHGQNYIHCSLTSHAVFLVSMHQAKVGNLEYMVETKKASTGRTCLVATSPHKEHVFRWMAPEIMLGDPPSAASDIYSFCCILWEMITSELPWDAKTLQEVRELHKSNTAQLPSPPKSVLLFQSIIEEGLKQDFTSRPRDFITLIRWLQGPLDKPAGWKPNALDQLKSLQKESKERISLTSRLGSFLNVTSKTGIEDPSSSSQQSASVDSSSIVTAPVQSANPAQPILTALRYPTSAQMPDSTTELSQLNNDSDITNNHNAASQQKSADTSNSCSTLDDSYDSLGAEVVDGYSITEGSRKRFLTHNADQARIHYPTKDTVKVVKNQIDRSTSCSTVKCLQKYSRRTASLPWQGSYSLLRAGSTSPRVSRSPHRHCDHDNSIDKSVLERSCKTLPLVKPASHSIDVKEFIRDNGSTTSPEKFDVISRRARRPSPRRSLPMSRNRSLVSPRSFVRSRSASGDVLEFSGKDVELSMPGSVRTLTEQFQARLYNHNLRQSILKGSMTPQGTLFEDLDTSPTYLKRSPNISEIPPEGNREKDQEIQDGEIQSSSSKGSSESLTSVSFREESILGEDEGHGFPPSTRNELDITEDFKVPKPTPVYPPYSVHCQSKTEMKQRSSIFQEYSAFRTIHSEQTPAERDSTDGCPGSARNARNSQFLPSSLPGIDISSHPFDFQDYYIDDDYTATCSDDPSRLDSHKTRDCEATHITDRSRRKIRNRVWLGDNMRKQNKTNKQSEEKREENREEKWWVTEQRAAEEYWKKCQDKMSEKQRLELDRCEQLSYGKEDHWLEDHWQSENQDTTSHHSKEFIMQNKNGERISDQSKEDQSSLKENLFFPELMEREDESKTDSHKEQNRERLVDFETGGQRGTNLERESRWEEFIRRSQTKSTTKIKDNREENVPMREDRQINENPAEKQEYENKGQDSFIVHANGENFIGAPETLSELSQTGKNSDHFRAEEEALLSGESSLSTVVERPVEAVVQQATCVIDDEDDENDRTLVQDDVADHRRCVLFNLERNTLSQEELQDPASSGDRTEDDGSNSKVSRRPPKGSSPESTLRKFYLGSSTGSQGYTTTLRVESSLKNPGSHRIMHTACDTSTGVIHTVHEETVQAETLRTTLGIQ